MPRLFKGAAALAALLVASTLLGPARAEAWVPIIPPIIIPAQATVWAHAPTTPEYRLNSGYTKNNYGDVVIRRTGVGAYSVILENAGSGIGGVAHVVAYGGSPVFCAVAASYPILNIDTGRGNHIIHVRCYNTTGAPIDSQFVATYTNVRNIHQGRLAYLTTDQAVPTGVRTIPTTMSYNSTGAPITYERIATGRYRVNFGPVPADEPSDPAYLYQVTAASSAAVHCQKVGRQHGELWSEEVWCSNASGQLVDSRFSVTHGARIDPLGNSVGPRFSLTWAFGDPRPGIGSYNSAIGWWYGVDRTYLATGRYEFTIEKMATPFGTAFVNSESWLSVRGFCVLANWGPSGANEKVWINCYQFGGSPADLDLSLFFTTWPAS